MTRMPFFRLRRFARDESAAVEIFPFVLWFPMFLFVMLSGIELGVWTARHTMLEHALDKTVRDVRLGTGTVYNRNSLKEKICGYATVLPDCEQHLQLEMVRLDIRDWRAPPAEAACLDLTQDSTGSGSGGNSDDVLPVVAFEYGRENELMLLRACYKYQPVSPAFGLGKKVEKDGAGFLDMVALGAFVHEPL